MDNQTTGNHMAQTHIIIVKSLKISDVEKNTSLFKMNLNRLAFFSHWSPSPPGLSVTTVGEYCIVFTHCSLYSIHPKQISKTLRSALKCDHQVILNN